MDTFYTLQTTRRTVNKRVKIGETGQVMRERLRKIRKHENDASLQVSTLYHVGNTAERKAIEALVRLDLNRAGYAIIGQDFITWDGPNTKAQRAECLALIEQSVKKYCDMLNITYTIERVG